MKYMTRPRGSWSEYSDMGVSVTADEVIIVEDAPEPSGVLNAEGEMLYRQRERIPFGFRGRHDA